MEQIEFYIAQKFSEKVPSDDFEKGYLQALNDVLREIKGCNEQCDNIMELE
jgi:hypothetical protein